jgi:hypothetical protein
MRFTPTRFAFAIARKDNKYVEVTYGSGAQRFDEVRRIVHIIFGVQAKAKPSSPAVPTILLEADHRDALALVETSLLLVSRQAARLMAR